MAQTSINIRINEILKHEWGHLVYGKLLSADEAAGVAGEWNNDLNISLKSKSAWAEAAVNKEMKAILQRN